VHVSVAPCPEREPARREDETQHRRAADAGVRPVEAVSRANDHGIAAEVVPAVERIISARSAAEVVLPVERLAAELQRIERGGVVALKRRCKPARARVDRPDRGRLQGLGHRPARGDRFSMEAAGIEPVQDSIDRALLRRRQ
jgi:hypothetical protein